MHLQHSIKDEHRIVPPRGRIRSGRSSASKVPREQFELRSDSQDEDRAKTKRK